MNKESKSLKDMPGGKDNFEKEETSEQEELSSTDENNSSFGKFKSKEELLKAYNNLEAQFTKRSQELKKLERENEQLQKEQATFVEQKDDSDICAQSHAVQDETGSGAKERTDEVASLSGLSEDEQIKAEVAKFLNVHPEATNYIEAIAQKTYEMGDVDDGFLEKAYIEVLKDEILKERNKVDDEFIYNKVNNLPRVKEKLIRDYLSQVSLGKTYKLMEGGGESAVMPPEKPQTIWEAGAMATKLLKRKG